MKKIFKAVSESIVIKEFADEIPEGWYPSVKEALSAFIDLDGLSGTPETPPKKRGRPRKVE